MFSLDLEIRAGWLHVTAHGVLDERSDRAIDERLVEECRRLGLDKALVDIRAMSGRLGIVANFEAASDFGERLQGEVQLAPGDGGRGLTAAIVLPLIAGTAKTSG